MNLLERVAGGNGGNPRRTIAALRLINERLKRDLAKRSSTQLVIRLLVTFDADNHDEDQDTVTR